MYSGGVGSWYTARRIAEKFGTDDLILLFSDTKMEDEDLYRFLIEGAGNIGGKLEVIAEGRDPWQVFFDVKFLGNSRIDPCSRILKRQILRKWLKDNCDPENTVVYIGIDWSEIHRFEKAQKYWAPWTCEAPLCDPPYVSKSQMLYELEQEGIERPRLYRLGFVHNNCGGMCVKAGQAQFRLLLKTMPKRYAYHEKKEQELQEHLKKSREAQGKELAEPPTILQKTKDGEQRNYSLKELREDIESGAQIDMFDWGGCACFSPDDYAEEELCEIPKKS